MILDHFYIPFSQRVYQSFHQNHECLIYGIDDKKQIYYIQDFFNGSYSSCEITFLDFWKAYLNHYDYSIFDDEKIYLFKKKSVKDNMRLPFQTTKIKSQFQNYLSGEISPIDNRTYGISCYDKMIERIRSNKIDFRDFCLLYEHTLANSIRMRSLSDLGILTANLKLMDSVNMVCKNALILRNRLLKWKITNQISYQSIEKQLINIKNSEIAVLYDFLKLFP